MRNVYNEDLRAPKVLQNCSIMFQAEACPAMDPFIPLLPPDFLVSYGDVIPGLRRFDTTGQLSVTTKQVISTLANPMLCPTHRCVCASVDRHGVCMHVCVPVVCFTLTRG